MNVTNEILIIDDDKVFVNSIKDLLELEGYVVKTAYNANDGITEAAKENHPSLILCDYYLPGHTGVEITGIVRETYKKEELPIILLTGDGSIEEDALKSGVNDFVLKGAALEIILLRIEKELDALSKLKEKNECINAGKYIIETFTEKNILKPAEYIYTRHFEYFIVDTPFDAIGGDFYWSNEINDRFYLTAGDCTGHGVQGALGTIPFYIDINEILEKEPSRPKVVLEEMKAMLNEIYKTNNHPSMDMVQTIIDFTTGNVELSYSNGLFFVKKQDGTIIKKRKKEIGGDVRNARFQSLNFTFDETEEIFFFSDGIDQLTDKVEFLFSDTFCKKTVKEQQAELNEKIEKMKKDETSRMPDDILIIGIKPIHGNREE